MFLSFLSPLPSSLSVNNEKKCPQVRIKIIHILAPSFGSTALEYLEVEKTKRAFVASSPGSALALQVGEPVPLSVPSSVYTLVPVYHQGLLWYL